MKSVLGLDIGSHTIKLVEIGRDGAKLELLAAGSARTINKPVVAQNTSETDTMVYTIKKLVREANTKSKLVNIALPESQVITRIIEVPQLSPRELATAIKWEAEQYIPLPLSEVTVDFSVLREAKETGTNKMEVLLVASPKTLIERYVSYVELADLTPNAVETEIIATSRALTRTVAEIQATMVVSLGAKTTDLAILRKGTLTYSRSISAGGEALSRALAQNLGFETAQAEEFKKAYGLERDKLEGKILTAVKPIMDTIIGEINRAVAFYQEKNKENIQLVLLSGGTAKLPGMVVYLAQSLNIEVQLASPWTGIRKDQRFQVLDTEGPIFTVACGLALREQ